VAGYWDGRLMVFFWYAPWGVFDGVNGLVVGSVSGVRVRHFMS
jgi:hypothetical protein